MRGSGWALVVSLGVVCGIASGVQPGAPAMEASAEAPMEAPGVTEDGRVLVDPEHAKHGTVYFVNDPMDRDVVTFRSEAPLEDIVGTSSEIRGYLVYDNNSPRRGLRGYLEVPVESLDTGIPLRNEHLRSDLWLDADQYPKITFNIVGTQSVRRLKYTTAAQTYEMVLVGPLTAHGRTVRLTVPARVTFLRESKETREKMEGDLLAVRARFDLDLDDLEITGPPGQDVIGTKVGETVGVDVSVFATDERAG